MSKENKERYSVNIKWVADDVKVLKPKWSLNKCEQVLTQIGDYLQDRSIEIGWEILEVLIDEYEGE